MGSWSWQRIGAAAGVLWFVVVLISFFLPETPDADDPTPQVVTELADDRGGLNVGSWLLGIGAVLFVVFTTALWSRLRDAERERGPSTLVLLGGLGSSLIIIVAAMVTRALSEAAGENREPAAVRALFELDGLLFVGIVFTSILFYAGIALCERAVRTLPAWLGITSAVLAAGFTIGSIGVATTAEDGGALAVVAFISILLNFLWILAASIAMLRDASRPVTPRGVASPPAP